MKKRGANFKGKVTGARGLVANAIRDAQRSARTEAIAQRFLKAKVGEKLDRHQIMGIAIGARSALEDVRVGRAEGVGVGWVVNAANISLLLCEAGFGPEHIPAVKSAQEALVRMINRHQTTGTYRLDGPGYHACVELLEIHDAQLECDDLTDAILLRAIEECKSRQEAGHTLDCAAV